MGLLPSMQWTSRMVEGSDRIRGPIMSLKDDDYSNGHHPYLKLELGYCEKVAYYQGTNKWKTYV